MRVCIVILPFILFGCGNQITAETPDTDSEQTPAEESGEPPAAPVDETAPVVQEESETVTLRLVVDAEGTEIGLLEDDNVKIGEQFLDVDLHQGFSGKDASVCYFKAANCEGECYTIDSETWSYMDGDTIFITTSENKRHIAITGADVDRPWLSETSEKGCIESMPSKSKGREDYHAAERMDFKLPFHLEQ